MGRENDFGQMEHWYFLTEWVSEMCELNACLFVAVLGQWGHFIADVLWVRLCERNMFLFFSHFPQTSHCILLVSKSSWVIACWASPDAAENLLPQTVQTNCFVFFRFSCTVLMCTLKFFIVILKRKYNSIIECALWSSFHCLLFLTYGTRCFPKPFVQILVICLLRFVVVNMPPQNVFTWELFATQITFVNVTLNGIMNVRML